MALATESELKRDIDGIHDAILARGADAVGTAEEDSASKVLKQKLDDLRNPPRPPRVISPEEQAEIERLNLLVAKALTSDLTLGELTDLFRNGRLG